MSELEKELGKRKQWPYQEALNILKRHNFDTERTYTFETGFGPSGFPHIGTFGEVVRTQFIIQAMQEFGLKTRLISFSDNLDGLRKVPENMPSWLSEHLGKPVSSIPDPFGTDESFSGHMNRRLREMLDTMGVDYEFKTSADSYGGGEFNEAIKLLLDNFQTLESIIAPTLSEGTLATWYPFFPVCSRCGKVMTTRVLKYHSEDATVDYVCDKQHGDLNGCGNEENFSIYNGNGKMTWRVDWPLRWYALGIDYELYGKDLIESFKIGQRIMRQIFKTPEPTNMFYEMFLDEEGAKISKSKGTGISVDEWLKYGSYESLVYLMYKMPKKAKELSHRIIPAYVAEVNNHSIDLYNKKKAGESTVGHVYPFITFNKQEEKPKPGISYSLVCNLLSALKTDDLELIAGYLEKLEPSVTECDQKEFHHLITQAKLFYDDLYQKETFEYSFDATAQKCLNDLVAFLQAGTYEAQEIHDNIFEIARNNGIEPKDFFRILYFALVDHERGPKLGSFIQTIGQEKTVELIRASLSIHSV